MGGRRRNVRHVQPADAQVALEPPQGPHGRRRLGLVGRPRRTRGAPAHDRARQRRDSLAVSQRLRQPVVGDNLQRHARGLPRHASAADDARRHGRPAAIQRLPLDHRRVAQLGRFRAPGGADAQLWSLRTRIHGFGRGRIRGRREGPLSARALRALAADGRVLAHAPHARAAEARALPLPAAGRHHQEVHQAALRVASLQLHAGLREHGRRPSAGAPHQLPLRERDGRRRQHRRIPLGFGSARGACLQEGGPHTQGDVPDRSDMGQLEQPGAELQGWHYGHRGRSARPAADVRQGWQLHPAVHASDRECRAV